MTSAKNSGWRTQDGARPDDAELLRRYLDDGSQAAFAELVERHVGLVYAAALRQLGGSVHRARDVAQTVFIDFARKARALARRDDLAGWFYTSTHYAAAKLKRAEQRREQREQEASMMHEISSGVSSDVEWERLRPVLDDAMHALSGDDRDAILLRMFQGRGFADVGRHLRVSEDAARMRFDRALEKLRALLGRHGITSTAAALSVALANPALVAAPAGFAATVTGMALEGAATGGATVATGAIIFMSKKTVVLMIGALAAIGVALYEAREARSAAMAVAGLNRERNGLRAQLQLAQRQASEADARADGLEQQSAIVQSELARVRASVLVSAAPKLTPTPALAAQGTLSLQPALSSDPAENRRLMRLQNIEGREISNRPLYRLLNLTPAQIEQLKILMVEDEDRRDLLLEQRMMAARAQTPPLDRAALQAVMQQAVDETHVEFKNGLRAAFGDQAVQTYGRFVATRAMREVTSRMANDLYHSDSPLTVEQTEQLVDILARNSRNAAGQVDLAAMKADAVEMQAQAVLSPAQLSALRRAQLDTRLKWVTGPGLQPAGK